MSNENQNKKAAEKEAKEVEEKLKDKKEEKKILIKQNKISRIINLLSRELLVVRGFYACVVHVFLFLPYNF